MTVEEKVYAILSGDSGITALVPASRIKVPGDLQGLARPFIVHRPVSGIRYNSHGGLANIRDWEVYQVSIFADTYSSGNAVARLIQETLGAYRQDGYVVVAAGGQWYVGRDPDLGYEHFALQFRIAEMVPF